MTMFVASVYLLLNTLCILVVVIDFTFLLHLGYGYGQDLAMIFEI